MSGGGTVVCVTGASGYVASWIVKLLLLRGYAVKATVRDPRDSKKTEHLLGLEGASERLELFKADLREEGSFEEAINGCDAVFHTASPVILTAANPQVEIIDPAVKGTINVLKTCAKTSSVKRVILTSSMASVIVREPPLGPNDVVDETIFSDPSVCEQQKQWYILSKTLSEAEALRFSKDNGIDLVVINPGLVIGPLLQPTLNFSVEVIVHLLNGINPFNTRHYRLVDVRDVAEAHVKAFENPSANGRYVVDGPLMTIYEIEKVLREFFPEFCIADRNEEKEMNPATYKVCVEKVKGLGVEFTPIEESLRDTIVSLKQKCLL